MSEKLRLYKWAWCDGWLSLWFAVSNAFKCEAYLFCFFALIGLPFFFLFITLFSALAVYQFPDEIRERSQED